MSISDAVDRTVHVSVSLDNNNCGCIRRHGFCGEICYIGDFNVQRIRINRLSERKNSLERSIFDKIDGIVSLRLFYKIATDR